MPTPDATTPAGADMVSRSGLIFRAGDYPAKSFSMSPDELRAAADAFEPCPIDLEHVPTILDGKLGHVSSVRLSDDGTELHGTVSMPAWLDRLLADGERRVSATWDRANKTLQKLALVRSPHVKDAALFAEFAAADPGGFIAAVRDDAAFATPRRTHDHATLHHQMIHDVIRMGYPGVCSGGPARPPGVGMPGGPSAAYFADHPQQLKSLRDIHATTVQNGAKCSGKASMSDTPSRSHAMSDENKKAEKTADRPAAFADADISALRAELDAARAAQAETAAKLAETTAAFTATQAEFAATQTRLEAARLRQVETDAAAFALAEIRAGREVAANYADLIADFSEAAEADHKLGGTVSFSDVSGAAKAGTRVEKLRARAARRPGHGLFTPALGDGELLHDGEKILFNGKPTEENEAAVQAKADAVLATFNEGRAVLARRAKAK